MRRKNDLPLITKRGAWHDGPVVQCAACRRIRFGNRWHNYKPTIPSDKISHTICQMCTAILYPEIWQRMRHVASV